MTIERSTTNPFNMATEESKNYQPISRNNACGEENSLLMNFSCMLTQNSNMQGMVICEDNLARLAEPIGEHRTVGSIMALKRPRISTNLD